MNIANISSKDSDKNDYLFNERALNLLNSINIDINKFADVKIYSSNVTSPIIYAHRIVLATFSSTLFSLFIKSNSTPIDLHYDNISYDIIVLAIEYLYTGSLDKEMILTQQVYINIIKYMYII